MGKAHDPNSERGRGRRDHPGREKKKEPGEQYLSPGKRYALEKKSDERDMNRPEPAKFRFKQRWEEKMKDAPPKSEYWETRVIPKSGTDIKR